mmetsp:Transcript_21169/g.50075  ORF Transcript_21169/g.50075 Transcript_21169/m.50075 type:complete len:238 (-) Transcript_21169:101-814(-)
MGQLPRVLQRNANATGLNPLGAPRLLRQAAARVHVAWVRRAPRAPPLLPRLRSRRTRHGARRGLGGRGGGVRPALLARGDGRAALALCAQRLHPVRCLRPRGPRQPPPPPPQQSHRRLPGCVHGGGDGADGGAAAALRHALPPEGPRRQHVRGPSDPRRRGRHSAGGAGSDGRRPVRLLGLSLVEIGRRSVPLLRRKQFQVLGTRRGTQVALRLRARSRALRPESTAGCEAKRGWEE